MRYGRDKWLAPLEVQAGSNVIKVREGDTGAWQDATITAGLAYPFYDDSFTSVNALYARARTAILAALGSGTLALEGDVSFDDLDPGSQRLRFEWSEGLWQIDADNSTFPMQWLGLGAGGVISSDSSGVLTSPSSCHGAWFSYNDLEGSAALKQSITRADLAYSSKRIWEAEVVDWGEQRLRALRYQRIAAARIVARYATDARFAALAGLDVGDVWASFEPVWRALNEGKQVLLVHDQDPGGSLAVGAEAWELITWIDKAVEQYPEGVARLVGAAGEYFDLALVVRVASGGYTG